jgi:predicted dehydrogenase
MAQFPLDQPTVARFGLIGCGNIGSRLDETAGGVVALTHASAIQRSADARLIAVCDTDPGRAQVCARRRGVPAVFTDFREMLAGLRLDAISIATPPIDRMDMIDTALDYGVRLIWCEKPLARNMIEARAIKERVERANAVFAVNYLRRWTTTARRMLDLVSAAQLGDPQGGVAYYGKGLLNNGSHLVDLLNMLVGLPDSVEATASIPDDRVGSDETLSAVLRYRRPRGQFAIQLVGTDHRRYSMFELDLLFAGGRMRLTDKGNRLEVQTVAADPIFPGYAALETTERHDGDLAKAFDSVLAQLLAAWRSVDAAPLCGAPRRGGVSGCRGAQAVVALPAADSAVRPGLAVHGRRPQNFLVTGRKMAAGFVFS